MSSHQRSGKPPEGSTSREPVDYTDQPTRPAVFIEDEVGQRWESPDGEVSVEVNFGAARRRLSRPPDYDLSEHYEAPTAPDQAHPHVPYQGPENFAPTEDGGEEVPETLPLDLAIYNDKPFKPWEPNATAPNATPGSQRSQGARRGAGRSQQLMRAMQNTEPAGHGPQRLAGGFSGDGPTRGNIAIVGAPADNDDAPLPPSPPTPHRQPPQRAEQPPQTTPPARPPHTHPRRSPGPRAHHAPTPPERRPPALRSAQSQPSRAASTQHDEPSNVFIADPYEQMALRRSALQIFVGVLILGVAVFGLLLLLTLAFFGEHLLKLLMGA